MPLPVHVKTDIMKTTKLVKNVLINVSPVTTSMTAKNVPTSES